MKTKVCCVCRRRRSIKKFSILKTSEDGLQYRCKDCQSVLSKKHYRNNIQKYKYSKIERVKNNPKRQFVTNTISNHKTKKHHVINLTTDSLYDYIKDKDRCEICGKKLDFGYGNKNNRTHHNSPSIDRIDNENELNINNIQLLCRDCNTTKGARTMKEFVEYCKMVSNKYN